jgi:hypothetical protein
MTPLTVLIARSASAGEATMRVSLLASTRAIITPLIARMIWAAPSASTAPVTMKMTAYDSSAD